MKLETEPQLLVEGVAGLLRKSYDRIAPIYNRTRQKAGWQDRVADRFMKLLPRGGRVLDMGCGVGIYMKNFLRKGFRVAGIDQSPKMVFYSRRRVPRGRFFLRNMVKPGFPAGSFDGILSLYAIIHVHHAQQPEVFRQMHRLLAPGGHFLINLGDENVREYVGEHCGEWMYWSGVPIGESLRRLKSAGFRILWKKGLGPKGDHHTWVIGQKR